MLQMDMRLGEGSGAALCFNIIEAANFTYKICIPLRKLVLQFKRKFKKLKLILHLYVYLTDIWSIII